MKFLTGDETGIVKLVRVEAQKVERFGPQRRGDAVEQMCWAGPSGSKEARLGVAHASGSLELRDGLSGKVIRAAQVAPSVKCIESLSSGSGAGGLVTVSADGSGGIVAGWSDESLPDADTAEEAEGKGVDDSVVRTFELPGPVADARTDPCGSARLVFGGGENDVKVYDMERGEVVWKAKNVRDNTLSLRVPVKVACLQWATQLAPSRSLILCGSTDGKVRLYDVNSQRRPLFELKIGFGAGAGTCGYTGTVDETARPVTCMSVAALRGDKWSLFMGNTMGVLREYDLRNLATCGSAPVPPGRKAHLAWAHKKMPFKRGYRGVMGSVRAVDIHHSGEALVAASLGRFAYVFETRKKKMQSKIFLKQKLCSVLLSSEALNTKDSDDEDSEEGEGAADNAGEGEEEEKNNCEDEVEEGFSSDEGGDGITQPADGDSESDSESDKDAKATTRKRKAPRRQQTTVIMPEEGDEVIACPAAATTEADTDNPTEGSERKPKRTKRRLKRRFG